MRLRVLIACTFLAPFLAAPLPAQSLPNLESFLYMAEWDSAANDFIHTSIQRLQMGSGDYVEFKDRFVDTFVAAISVPADEEGMVNINLALDPAAGEGGPLILRFDPVPSATSVNQNGSDIRALGEWTFYFWQLSLWEWYVTNKTLMLDENFTVEDMDRFVDVIQSPREAVWTWTEMDPEDGEPREWIQVRDAYPALEEADPQMNEFLQTLRANSETLDGEIHAPQVPVSWGFHEIEANAMRRMFEEAAYAVSAREHDTYFGIVNRLRDRQEARDRYYDWKRDRENMVIEFTREWARKYDGTEFDIDGVTYLISPIDNPVTDGVRRTGRRIDIDRVVTPHDIINTDGSLKRPIPIED